MLLAVRPLMNLTLSDKVDIIIYGNASNLTGTDITRFRLQQPTRSASSHFNFSIIINKYFYMFLNTG